jgi:hypothetical protein
LKNYSKIEKRKTRVRRERKNRALVGKEKHESLLCCGYRGARESQSSDFAQRERAREEEEEEEEEDAPMENFHGTPPFQTGGSREVADSAAMSWEEGSIAFQNRGRRGSKHQQGWWSNHMKASSKKLLAGLASVSSNQPSRKKVDVSSHVLETYHDSFLYGRVPLAVKIRAGLRGGFIGYMWHIVCTCTLGPHPSPFCIVSILYLFVFS